jgi:hypothetical protein
MAKRRMGDRALEIGRDELLLIRVLYSSWDTPFTWATSTLPRPYRMSSRSPIPAAIRRFAHSPTRPFVSFGLGKRNRFSLDSSKGGS